MNGNQNAIPGKDVSRLPSPGLGWDELPRELVTFLSSIKLAMFLFSGARKG